MLESVLAERNSHAVEMFGLLPMSHFGARQQRSAEQALVLLQEYIYRAWRKRNVVSLVSFDVEGAYNGVYKERLLQRLKARGIPGKLGSPLPPVFFLFFNADLVQHQIDENGGAFAFVDNYTAWVTVRSRGANRQGICLQGWRVKELQQDLSN
ncbi:hypothetical protein CLIM01_13914 [Colletotrichum limetticola]|uniref:Reverse transcriptase domain-containing protein n=1 Tax=Colletotrichum limetticola TaxID=1209924 RepID=A0ABQ9PFR8_9PEZI|nr:hypothetical protein CLIM01_13914 [Colletotrichum limetticola]